MSPGRLGLRAMVLGGLATLILLLGAQGAGAAPSTHCVKATKETKIVNGKAKKVYTGGWTNSACTGVSPTHEGKYEYLKTTSLSEPEQEELKALLKYVKVEPSGVAGKPTVQVSGANVQIVSGAGKTNAAVNGAGNLVIGYDEFPGTQTGSHDVILGEEQTFTSYGGIDVGRSNTISGPFASVSGGLRNKASGEAASVSGGVENEASNRYASVSGGGTDKASGEAASVSGGFRNEASNIRAAVSGGVLNLASGGTSWVGGGEGSEASGSFSSVSGGFQNGASGLNASVSGGESNRATSSQAWIGGGVANEILSTGKPGEEGRSAAIFGGKANKTSKNFEAIP